MTSTLDRTSSSAAVGVEGTSSPAYDAGLLVLRVGLGLIMAAHGAQKLFGWFGGGGIEGTGQFFAMVGYPSGEAMALIAGLSETLGGLALALGLLTPLAGAAVLGTMINAMAVKWGGGFFAPDGVEYELFLAVAAAGLTLTGPGRLAVDRFLPVLRVHRLTHGVAAVVLGAVVAGIVLLVRG
ncbi:MULTISPECIES: DoxX family protein [Streptomyces]|uniref:DoxX family membrane protein n=1 Tax=Streptomyces viridosporus T7A TaxID=665577 RepID=A0ABX6AMN4_STRVD|nr:MULTISPECIES: DoxX family membrane protein [Streptomyces]PWJ05933.1 DoxX family membrane protein [Streptomyces sp. NWU49]QEU88283.1 DoxX family membrane protein [Streptomyces viridosporus T7A]